MKKMGRLALGLALAAALCGAARAEEAACAHRSLSEICVPMEQVYTAVDDGVHRVTTDVWMYWTCDVCGERFSGRPGMGAVMEAPHDYVNGVCALCGHRAGDEGGTRANPRPVREDIASIDEPRRDAGGKADIDDKKEIQPAEEYAESQPATDAENPLPPADDEPARSAPKTKSSRPVAAKADAALSETRVFVCGEHGRLHIAASGTLTGDMDLDIEAGEACTVSFVPGKGVALTVTATPDEEYVFERWESDKHEADENPELTYTFGEMGTLTDAELGTTWTAVFVGAD